MFKIHQSRNGIFPYTYVHLFVKENRFYLLAEFSFANSASSIVPNSKNTGVSIFSPRTKSTPNSSGNLSLKLNSRIKKHVTSRKRTQSREPEPKSRSYTWTSVTKAINNFEETNAVAAYAAYVTSGHTSVLLGKKGIPLFHFNDIHRARAREGYILRKFKLDMKRLESHPIYFPAAYYSL